MAAYVIADIAGVTDAEKIAAYRELSTRATAAGGGRFVARGGQVGLLALHGGGNARGEAVCGGQGGILGGGLRRGLIGDRGCRGRRQRCRTHGGGGVR